jgi:hypothetical protein
MPIWPRWVDKEGQDQKVIRPHKKGSHKKKNSAQRIRFRADSRSGPPKSASGAMRDEQKFEDGLTKMMKSRAKAQAYIRRKKLRETK